MSRSLVSIYVARSLELTEHQTQDWWTQSGIKEIRSRVLGSISIMDPATIQIPKIDFAARYSWCVSSVTKADILICDLTEAGNLGLGAEMMLANKLRKTVLTVCPPNSQFRKVTDKNLEWIHPFVFGLSNELFVSRSSLLEQIGIHIERALNE